jgi:adhesin transport system membrane fusion protein
MARNIIVKSNAGAVATQSAPATPAVQWADLDYLPPVRAAGMRGAHRYAHALLIAIVAFLVIAFLWAANAPLDEVTRGQGRVIPSSQLQSIQHLEGGIIAEILVHEGERVNVGDVLVKINSPTANAEFRDNLTRFYTLSAAVARLEAESEGREPVWPERVAREAPAILADARLEYSTRQERFRAEIATVEQQVQQRRQEILENQARASRAGSSLAILGEELRINQSLEGQGAVSRVEVLRLQRQASDLRGEIAGANASVARAQAGLQEAQRRLEERRANFRQEAFRDMSQKRAELSSVTELIEARRDRVERAEVRSPVVGIVNRINVSTIGGVVQPGQEIMSVVPIEDTLVIEAQIRPQDIGFIRPDQNAMVKITAYDFSISGGLNARIENISADTITDQQGNAFFKVRLRTQQAFLGPADHPLPIIPGMQASVEILTGRKTVLEYLLHPLLRARDTALRER